MGLSGQRTRTAVAAMAVAVLAACGGSGGADQSSAASKPADTAHTPVTAVATADDVAPSPTSAPVPTTSAPITVPTTAAPSPTGPTAVLSGGSAERGVVLASVDAAAAESIRAEMFMRIVVVDEDEAFELGTLDEPVVLMETQGAERASMAMDMSVLVPPELGPFPFDPTMDVVMDGTAMYIRGGVFTQLGSELGPGFEDFAALGDGWGVIDVTAFEDLLPEDVAAALGQQGMGLDAYLAVVQTLSGVSEGSPSEVRGRPTTHFVVETSFGDWIQETSGVDLDEFSALLGSVDGADDTLNQLVFDAMFELPLLFDVHVDSEGRLRRLDMIIDMQPLFLELGAVLGTEVPPGLRFEMTVRVDVVDYDPTIVVEVPSEVDVDLTDAFWNLTSLQS